MLFRPRPFSPSIEPLEARIAPATIRVGFSGVGDSDIEYSEVPFITAGAGYSLLLKAGDKVQLFNIGSGYKDFIVVNEGQSRIFFVDKDFDNEVDANEITGVSLGKGTAIRILGGVDGDIVANLDSAGLVNNSLVHNIKSIVVSGGSVAGSVLVGGNLKGISVVGSVNGILGGTAADGVAFDFGGGNVGVFEPFSSTPAPGANGASIKNGVVGSVSIIQAGDAGLGGKGGGIDNFRVISDTDGFIVRAGRGGNEGAGFGAGAGGSVKNFFGGALERLEGAFADPTAGDLVQVLAGHGGDGVGGAGGKGGNASKVFIGYFNVAGKPVLGDDVIRDAVSVVAGNGGDGAKGGNGGNVNNSKIAAKAENAGPGAEMVLSAGSGGDAVGASGKGGNGGNAKNADARNLNSDFTTGLNAGVLVNGGVGGGSGLSTGRGGDGGSVTGAKLAGFDIVALGGLGGQGASGGGMGGTVDGLTVFNVTSGVFNASLLATGGDGGSATVAGKGGKGGSVLNVVNLDANFFDPAMPDPDQRGLVLKGGTGGEGLNGNGGAGGRVQNVNATTRPDFANAAYVILEGGEGGKAVVSGKGGNGGGVKKASIFAQGSPLVLGTVIAKAAGGDGGATDAGNGGRGGAVRNIGFIVGGDVAANGGSGGDGTVSGGAGGDLKKVNLNTNGTGSSATAASGDGGNGGSANGGAGGAATNVALQSRSGSAFLGTGTGGTGGVKGGKGGAISVANLIALNSPTVLAGNGQDGGNGGSITNVGISSPFFDFISGNVTVAAGDSLGAGKGGAINGVDLVAGTGITAITAGSSIGSAVKGKSGGSIQNANILAGGGPFAEIRIAAGDSSDSTGAAGATGGAVSGVAIQGTAMDPDTVVRHIAGGDGGAAGVGFAGGVGGGVNNVRVQGLTIGVMSGETYGFLNMGGIFAGLGASGANNGSVTNISADAIAAIVAGKAASPQLVERVDRVYLSGLVAPTVNGLDGSFTTFDGTNAVGAVVVPGNPNASTFQFTNNVGGAGFDAGDDPVDGLIAAKTLTANRNFVPGAFWNGVTLSDPDKI